MDTWEWVLLGIGLAAVSFAIAIQVGTWRAVTSGETKNNRSVLQSLMLTLGTACLCWFFYEAGQESKTPKRLGDACVAAIRLDESKLSVDMVKEAQKWIQLAIKDAECRSPSSKPVVTLRGQPVEP